MNGLPGSAARAIGRLFLYLCADAALMPVQAVFARVPLAFRREASGPITRCAAG